MGVIRKFIFNNSEDYVFDLEDVNDSNDEFITQVDENEINNQLNYELNEQSTISRNSRNRRIRSQQKKITLKPEPAFRGLGCRGKSHKKNRRYENANFLTLNIQAADLDEDELYQISIYDFVPQTVSVFAQILMDKNNMKAWNDFIECSEKEQETILNNIKQNIELDENENEKKSRKKSKSSPKNYLKDRTSLDIVQSADINKNISDERRKHPAYAGKKCFERIDLNIKDMLKKKHIPLNILQRIEEEIIDFFSKEPFSTYKSCLSSGYQRLLLHACCQYLDLTCKSFNQNGARWSKVQNPNHYFIPPLINLTSYLENYSIKKKS